MQVQQGGINISRKMANQAARVRCAIRSIFLLLIMMAVPGCADKDPVSSQNASNVDVQGAAGSSVSVANNIVAVKLEASSAVPETIPLPDGAIEITRKASTSAGALAISANGKTGAFIDEHERVVIWDIKTNDKLELIDSVGKNASAVALSADGRKVAIGYSNATLVIWSRDDKKVDKEYPGHTARITAVAFSPDGSLLASGSDDNLVLLWDVSTGKKLHEFVTRSGNMVGSLGGRILKLAFSGNGKILVSHEFFRGQYEVGRGLTLRDSREGFEIKTGTVTPPNTDNIERSALAVGGAGWLLAYTVRDGIELERLENCGATRKVLPGGGYADTLAMDNHGKWVAAITGNELEFYDAIGTATKKKMELPPRMTAIDMVAQPDGGSVLILLAIQDNARNIGERGGIIISVAVPQEMQSLQAPVASENIRNCSPSDYAKTEMGYSVPDNPSVFPELYRVNLKRFASGDANHASKESAIEYARLQFTDDDQIKAFVKYRNESKSWVFQITPENRKPAQSRSSESVFNVVSTKDSWIGRDTDGSLVDLGAGTVFQKIGSSEGVQYPLFAADTMSGKVYLETAESIMQYSSEGARVKKFPREKKRIVSMSASNERLAVLYDDNRVQVFSNQKGAKPRFYGPLNKEGNCDLISILLTADGKYLQTEFDCGDGGAINFMLGVETGKWRPSHGFAAELPKNASRAIVYGERPHQLAIYDFATAAITARLSSKWGSASYGQYAPPVSAISNDGNQVASAAEDGTIRIWNIEAKKFTGAASAGGKVSALIFSKDGKKIAACVSNGDIAVFDTTAAK